MSATRIYLTQGTREWLEYRKNKRNASEAGEILGVGFSNSLVNFARKKFLGELNYINDAMVEGQKYEPKIREILSKKYNANFISAVFLKDEIYSASLDCYDAKTGQIAEIKMSVNEYEFVKENNKPSEKYYAQVQHQMYVMDANECIFGVGVIDDDFNIKVLDIIVKRDDAYIAKLLKAWDDFWNEYSDFSFDINDDELAELANKYNDLYAQIQALKTDLESTREQIISKISTNDNFKGSARINNITITQSKQSERYDYKAFCDSLNLKITDDFLKKSNEKWIIRVKN